MIRRQDPPEPGSDARAGARRWDAVAEQLRAAPGEWFLVLESVSSSTYAEPLRNRGMQTRTVTVRPRPGAKRRFDLYARAPRTELDGE